MQVSTIPSVELSEETFDKMCKSLAAIASAAAEAESTTTATAVPAGSSTVEGTAPLSHNDSMREMMSSLLFV